MITAKQKEIQCKKTCIRVACYFLMVLSICAFFSPITTLLGYVPLLGGVLSSAVGFAIFLAALIVCIPLFILAVGISWLVFHPKVGLLLLGVGLLIGGIVLMLVFKNKGNENNQQTLNMGKHFLFLRSFMPF
jgi:predicted phage tail protein